MGAEARLKIARKKPPRDTLATPFWPRIGVFNGVMKSYEQIIGDVCRIAQHAGEVIMDIYRADFSVREKSDTSPVTEADVAAERLITEALVALTPDIPVVAEEDVSAGQSPDVGGGRFWLVDPLDGTKEFVNRNGEFTVNIGLIIEGAPVLGIVHAPAVEVSYFGFAPDTAFVQRSDASVQPIRARTAPAEGLVVVVSRSHRNAETDAFLAKHQVVSEQIAGSALKFGLVATGEADLYPRLGRTMEWDTAAGHAVLRAAGGRVETTDGEELVYGKTDFANPPFVAWGRSS